MHLKLLLVLTLLGTASFCPGVSSHGRLVEPPSRSSMWRYGFNTTVNYNDHELYCGGFARHQKNKGCGVCGDPMDGPKPNEAGGIYAQGIIVRKYRRNSIIRVKVELTANHKGFFEFRLCPNNNPKKVVSQTCLDNNLLQQSNNEGPKYYPGEGTKVFESRYILPKDLTCTQCVLQWQYRAANSWGGPCSDGTEAGLGCGPQEEFRACSDIAIYDDKGYASAEQPETDEVGKSNNTRHPQFPDGESPSESETHSTRAWPFTMVFIALIVVAVGFGSILWWFYKKQIMKFVRATSNQFQPKDNSQTTSYIPQSYSMSVPPVVPPRTKKQPSPISNYHPEVYGQRPNTVTPDVIKS